MAGAVSLAMEIWAEVWSSKIHETLELEHTKAKPRKPKLIQHFCMIKIAVSIAI
jgi:hypothetical protein